MIAVTTTTGLPMRIGEAVLDPVVPTLFEEVPKEVEFQRINLRFGEVDGPDDPALGNLPYRLPNGETVRLTNDDALAQPEVVSSEDHVAVVNERDQLKANLLAAQTTLTGLAQKESQYNAVVDERDTLKTDLQEAKDLLEHKDDQLKDLPTVIQERDGLKAQVEQLQTEAPDLSNFEPFLPTTKAQIGALSIEKLQALAKIRGKQIEGDDKAPYIAALSPQE